MTDNNRMSKYEDLKINRIGEESVNSQGCPMRIIEYIRANNILVEFQDKHKARVRTSYAMFCKGKVKNPYFPSVIGVGIVGEKYPVSVNRKAIKEYDAWRSVLVRCFDKRFKEKYPTYQNVTCCQEWLYYPNFYDWLHSQENFDKWHKGEQWNVDKDILVKGNKIYSPETCCLVPNNINKLFSKNDLIRGNLPIGVRKSGNKFQARCNNPFLNQSEYLGTYLTTEDAFYLSYKPYKEKIIKQMAQFEYEKGNITKKCYDAMMKYEVEITD